MRWESVIRPSEISEYRGIFPHLKNTLILKVITRLLKGIGAFIEHPVSITVPADIEDYKGDPEEMRALRILKKLRTAGIIKSFYEERVHYPDEPQTYSTYTELGQNVSFGFSGRGSHVSNKKATLWPAVGESLERYAMRDPYMLTNIDAVSSYKDLKEPKVDIFNIAGLDADLRRRDHFHYNLAYDENTSFRWTKVTELPSKRQLLAPIQWFTFAYTQRYCFKRNFPDPKEAEPLLAATITTGAAAGQNPTDAVYRGLLEVIERDAFMIYWLNQMAALRIDLTSFNSARFETLSTIAKDYALEIHLLYLKTDMPTHTVCSVVIDRTGVGPAVLVGAKAGLNLEEVAYEVLGETLAQRSGTRRMMEHNKDFVVPEDIYKMNHQERMLYWFNAAMLKEIEHFISGPMKPFSSFPVYDASGSVNDRLIRLLAVFEEKHYQVFYREILDPKLKELAEGVSVTVVRVPQMHPLYLEESMRSVGGKRLREIPKLLGYEPAKEFSTIPHPFP